MLLVYSNGVIEIELILCLIADPPPYVALSYDWGATKKVSKKEQPKSGP